MYLRLCIDKLVPRIFVDDLTEVFGGNFEDYFTKLHPDDDDVVISWYDYTFPVDVTVEPKHIQHLMNMHYSITFKNDCFWIKY